MDRLFLPLGLLYVADALEQQGTQVEILHRHATPENINYVVTRVTEDLPDWVGFSAYTNPGLSATIQASKRIKKGAPGVKVVWGGAHPMMVKGVEREAYVDVAVRGPGEEWVTGRHTQHLDEFQPAWHLIESHVYGLEIHLVTSRGCLHRCGFCYSPAVFKRRWRAHSIEKVLEIVRAYQDLSYLHLKEVQFRDDYFFTNQRRAIEIVNQLGLPWMATIRADDLRPELLKQLNTRPNSLSVGVESASQRLLDLMRKDITLKDVEIALNTANKEDVPLYLTFIVGLPTETPTEREATITWARDLEREYSNVTCKVKPYRCYPGTYLYHLALKEGFNPPKNTEEWAQYALEVWKPIL